MKLLSVVVTFAALVTLVVPSATAQTTRTVSFREGNATPITGVPYTGTEDTFIWTNETSGHTNANAGASIRMDVGTFNGPNTKRHSLIRFDLSSLTGQYHHFTQATLRLHVYNYDSGSETINIYQLSDQNKNWIEGTHQSDLTINPPYDKGTSVWNAKILDREGWAGSPGASTPIVDYKDTLVSSNVFSSGIVAGSYLDFVFTDPSILAGWVDGTNSGLILKTALEQGNNRIQFATSDHPDIAMRPELLVTYFPLSAAAPEPGTLALIAVTLSLGGIIRRMGRRAITRR